eukprot:COSAG01_NODE_11331_length_1955_cov_1.907328_1_plen_272_part_00
MHSTRCAGAYAGYLYTRPHAHTIHPFSCHSQDHFCHESTLARTLLACWALRILGNGSAQEQPQEIYSLEKYAEETASCFLYLLLQSGGYAGQISAESNDLTTAQEAATCRAVSHIGTAMGLTILLQGAPHYASRRQCPLPASIMALHGVSVEDFYRALRREETPSDGCGEGATTVRGGTPGTADNGAAGLADVFYDVAGNAAVHLEHARRLRSEVPTQWRPLLLPAALADDYLKRLQAAHFDGFHPVLQAGLTSPFRLQCRLLRHWAQGYY